MIKSVETTMYTHPTIQLKLYFEIATLLNTIYTEMCLAYFFLILHVTIILGFHLFLCVLLYFMSQTSF